MGMKASQLAAPAGILIALFAAWLFLMLEGRTTFAGTYVVNTLADNTTDDAACTLREAVMASNGDASYNGDCGPVDSQEDRIRFSDYAIGTIWMTNTGDLRIQNSLWIDGEALGRVTIRMGLSGWIVRQNGRLILSQLTFRGGNVAYSVIGNSGVLSINHVVFVDNTITLGNGGVVANSAGVGYTPTLYMDAVTVRNNRGSLSGGISNGGYAYIANSLFISNVATGTLATGAIHNSGEVIVVRTIISGNVGGHGGGLSNGGPRAKAVVLQSYFVGNQSLRNGGGIFAFSDTFVEQTLFERNIAKMGGGIYFTRMGSPAVLEIRRSAFSRNGAWGGGGVMNENVAYIANTTFFSNTSVVAGGAIHNSGVLHLNNNTLFDNSAPLGGGLYLSGTVKVTSQNTIWANAWSGDCWGGAIAGVANLFSATNVADSCGVLNGLNGNWLGVDPLLDSVRDDTPLGDLMRRPIYLPPLPNSPAINTGHTPSCERVDQRGVARPQGAACDVGAIERGFAYLPLVQRE